MTDFDRAYRENAELVYRYVFSLTRNADLAEEVTQQTFYEAIRHPGNYRGEAALSTYLCGIAGNLMKKELSRRVRENHVPIEEMTDLPGEGSAEAVSYTHLDVYKRQTYDYLLDQLINSPEMRQKRIRWRDEGFQMTEAWFETWSRCV